MLITPFINPLTNPGTGLFAGQTMSKQEELARKYIAEREREVRLREVENLRVQNLREQIHRVQGSDMEDEIRNLTIRSLDDQINQIFTMRTERERISAELERELRQFEQDTDSAFDQTDSGLHTSWLNTSPVMQIESTAVEGNEEDDAENDQVSRQKVTIARITTAAYAQIGSIYRDTQALQEAQIRASRGLNLIAPVPVPEGEGDEEEPVPPPQKEHEATYRPVINERL